jgi:uncharacterized protein with HEPN domain
MSTFDEMLKIADIHVDRITMALDDLRLIFPLNQDKILNFSKNEVMLVELLLSRFAKLQDYMGEVIFDHFLRSTGDYKSNLTMIDKINKLERLEVIEDAEIWKKMRRIRNHISHEYPDHPELMAQYINQVFELAPQLIEILNHIKLIFRTRI